MIKVNLLPPEYRKVERTPVLRFATIVAGVVPSILRTLKPIFTARCHG